jgi:flagellar biosynthesis protein FlhF
MRLKSYFSGTVEAAMDLARKELGEEALLVNARPATPETRYLGEYEVVFGLASKGAYAAEMHTTVSKPLAEEIADLKREFERMAQGLRNFSPPGARPVPVRQDGGDVSGETDGLYSRLIAQDLDQSLAQRVAAGTPLEELVQTDSMLGRPGCSRRAVVLVGPPGAGKTTTLVKLAARFGLQTRRASQILSADVYRIGASDQLRCLASILGIGCDVAGSAAALAQMLDEHRSKELVFVDTPGLTRAEVEDVADLAELVRSHPELDAHLVLPAYLRPSDMSRAIQLYSCFGPKKLLFSRIDETVQYGPIAGESARWSLPISFLTNGQQIPDDLEPASPEKLSELILGATQPRRQSAMSKGASA